MIGVDKLSDYDDVTLKQTCQAMLLQSAAFKPINDRIETPDLIMGHSCADLLTLPITVLLLHRYGPWDRPDMAPMSVCEASSTITPARQRRCCCDHTKRFRA